MKLPSMMIVTSAVLGFVPGAWADPDTLAPGRRVRVLAAPEVVYEGLRLSEGARETDSTPLRRTRNTISWRRGDDILTLPRPGRVLVGEVLSMDDQALTLSTGQGKPPVTIPRKSIVKLRVSEGRRPGGEGALIGAGAGVFIGAATGTVVGFLSGDDHCECFRFTAGQKAVIGGVTLGAFGTVVGMITGASAPGERWRTIPLPGRNHATLNVSPAAGGGVRVAMRLGF
jgi:hypothetical protein